MKDITDGFNKKDRFDSEVTRTQVRFPLRFKVFRASATEEAVNSLIGKMRMELLMS